MESQENPNYKAVVKLTSTSGQVSLQDLATPVEKAGSSLGPGVRFCQPRMKESHGAMLVARQRLKEHEAGEGMRRVLQVQRTERERETERDRDSSDPGSLR